MTRTSKIAFRIGNLHMGSKIPRPKEIKQRRDNPLLTENGSGAKRLPQLLSLLEAVA